MDIGPHSAEIFCDSVWKSGTVLWNGPMGVFDMQAFAQGTFAIAQCLAEVTDKGVVTIIEVEIPQQRYNNLDSVNGSLMSPPEVVRHLNFWKAKNFRE